ncbi:hypothetical protein EG329_001838 [Mollisiaceae sp. DMI_Dod_QoI]|nr:hypothetical protein EG329_001838 [Helotiales sp. DMI_Dod_QoI]
MGSLRNEDIVSDSIQALEAFLASNPSIEFIRFQWLDFAGVLAARVTTIPFALSLVKGGQPLTTPSPILTALVIDCSILLEDIEMGGDRLWPDWTSVKVCHYHPNHAQVMCFVDESGHVEGDGFRRCPRSRLLELTRETKMRHGVEFEVGTEIEFFIMEEGLQQAKMVANTYSAASLNNKYLPVIEEIVHCITKAGISVRQFHSEGGPGVFEISTEPLPPLQSADALVYCQEAIKVICRKHGLHGTMFPKPFEKLTGIGLHYHLSMSQNDHENSFLSGLLDHWKALAAFYMPNYDSYTRVRPGQQVTWGFENRTAAIRKIRAGGRWELRAIDGTANPHLSMLAIITAGMLGLENGQELKMSDCQKIMIDKALDEKEAKEHGVTQTMPTSLKESLTTLRNDKALTEKLGPAIIDKYLKLKEKENEIFGNLTLSERKEISMRLF